MFISERLPFNEGQIPVEHEDEYRRCWGNYQTWKVYDWLARSYHRRNIKKIAQEVKFAGRGLRAMELLICDYLKDELPDLGASIFNFLLDDSLSRIDFKRIARAFYGPDFILECSSCGFVRWSTHSIGEEKMSSYWEECPECGGRLVLPRHPLDPEQFVKSGIARDNIAANRILNRLAGKGHLPFQDKLMKAEEAGEFSPEK